MIQFQDVDLPLDALDGPAVPSRESYDPQSLGDLADDMAVNGLLQPIGVRGPSPEGRYETVWGDRRQQAARMLQWVTIPARVCAWTIDPLVARLSENLVRADLNAREEARQIAELRTRGKPLAEIGRIMRRSVAWCESRLELLKWPVDLQDAVVAGTLTFAAARLLGQVDHDDYRRSLVEEAQRTGATARVIDVWLAHYHADRERIIRNRETVEQIVGRRESFIVMYVCDSCREQRDSRHSVLLRICPACLAVIQEAQADEARGGARDTH